MYGLLAGTENAVRNNGLSVKLGSTVHANRVEVNASWKKTCTLI